MSDRDEIEVLEEVEISDDEEQDAWCKYEVTVVVVVVDAKEEDEQECNRWQKRREGLGVMKHSYVHEPDLCVHTIKSIYRKYLK